MDQLEFYKDLFHKENDRRHLVNNSLNIPIAIISALSAGIFYFITNYKLELKLEYNLNLLFFGLIFISIISILISAYFLIRVFVKFRSSNEYCGIPLVKVLNKYYNELLTHYDTEEEANDMFKEYLLDIFVMIVDNNMGVNDKKFGLIFISKRWTVVCLTSTLLCSIPFIYNFSNRPSNVQKFELISNHDPTVQPINPITEVDTLISNPNTMKKRKTQEQTTTKQEEKTTRQDEKTKPPTPPDVRWTNESFEEIKPKNVK